MKINEIKNIKYEGYIWLSDQEKPKVLHAEKYDFTKHCETENPFIIEALLYAKDEDIEDISVTIKHTGKYQIHEIDLKNLPKGAFLEEFSDNDDKHKLQYLALRKLKNVEKLKFKQLWLPEKDENCNNWEVLKMKALVFTGFINKKS